MIPHLPEDCNGSPNVCTKPSAHKTTDGLSARRHLSKFTKERINDTLDWIGANEARRARRLVLAFVAVVCVLLVGIGIYSLMR